MSTAAISSWRSADQIRSRWATLTLVLLGSVFLAIMARISIPLPFTPVPVTMQTLAVFLLGGMLGGKKAALSVGAYLIEGTVGLPVFSKGLANPSWFLGATAGYLLGFVAAAYAIGTLLEKRPARSFYSVLAIVSIGEVIILSLGTAWMSVFLGFNKAFAAGIVPFVIGGSMKVVIAASLLYGSSLIKNSFANPKRY
jgi:biotin transport system substrate-specific component